MIKTIDFVVSAIAVICVGSRFSEVNASEQDNKDKC
jgi:hypothetical protein